MNALTNYTTGFLAGSGAGAATYLAIDKRYFAPMNKCDSVVKTIKVFSSVLIPAIGSGLATAAVSLTRDNSYSASFLTGALSSLIIPITFIGSFLLSNR